MIGFNLNIAKRHFMEMLAEKFPQREVEQLMRILLEDLFDIDLKRQLMDPGLCIDEFQFAQLERSVDRLMDGVPVQYVTGKAWFDGLLFQVDGSVLIPRPETEELVRLAAEELASKADAGPLSDKPLRIWDVGTGSGCIAVALAKRFPEVDIKAFDVSERALEMALRNTFINKVNVDFICDDVLHPQSDVWRQPVEMVVSNPPYIRESEGVDMEPNVLDFEPASALFVPDEDPLLFYRQILTLAKPQLSPHGSVWFEINEAMGEEMVLLCRQMGFDAELRNDFLGKTRFIRGQIA